MPGPPKNNITLAPQLGYTDSNSPTAIDRATPTDLSGRFPVATGQGSGCSSSSRSLILMSHLARGCRNLWEMRVIHHDQTILVSIVEINEDMKSFEQFDLI